MRDDAIHLAGAQLALGLVLSAGLAIAAVPQHVQPKLMTARLAPAAASVAQVATPSADAQDTAVIRLQDLSPDQARKWNASNPIAPGPKPAAKPFHLDADGVLDEARALDCMTAAIYYEAGFESTDGQRAVAQVVLNRMRHPAFPKTVCGVVFQGSDRSTGCQFTFTCDGSMAARIEPNAWERARRVAEAALNGFVYTPVGSATYYHTTAVSPWWAPKLTRVAQIGAHIFYRLPGSWGGALAFDQHYGGIEPLAAPGRLFREKSTAQIVDAVEAGVTIHRGASDNTGATTAAATPTESFGVRIHHGGSGSEPHQFGVTVHVIGGADADATSAT